MPSTPSAARRAAAERCDELDVAVIGMAGRFPGAGDVDRFWDNLRDGVESVRDLSEDELSREGVSAAERADPAYVRRAAVLDDVDRFDPQFFGFSPREAEAMDPQSRQFLEVCWQALEDAGVDPSRSPSPIGVFGGASLNTYLLRHLYDRLDVNAFTLSGGNIATVIGNGPDFLATRVAYRLGLGGPALDVQTACSSSLVAVHLARQSLLADECGVALAGGVSIYLPQHVGYRYEEGLILSPDGRCRPFDARAAGTVFGRGVGVVALKLLSQAILDGDRVLAVLKGSAVNNDGSDKVGYTAPGVDGQSGVIAEALGAAGVEPSTIGYLETHGTGTAQGDPIEVAGLRRAFRDAAGGDCLLGSVKANIGHLDAASGIAGMIKVVQMLRHREIPALVHFDTLHPGIDLQGTPFRIAATRTPWERGSAPRRAGVSSFGIGGTNAHVILEEAPEPVTESDLPARPRELLQLSAKSEAALDGLVDAVVDTLGRDEDALADLCHSARTGRTAFPHRLAVTADDATAMAAALEKTRAGKRAPGVVRGRAREEGASRLAFVFTGQGAQYPGMGRELYDTLPLFRRELDRADEVLRPLLDRSIVELMHADAEDSELDRTAFTQPALVAIELALFRVWTHWGFRPTVVLGHSVGEYAAATAVGLLSFADGLRLIAERGRLMQSLPAGGAMAAALGPLEAVREAIADRVDRVSVAAQNGPRNNVIAGPAEDVDACCAILKERGIASKRLAVSHAFHSPLMEPILEPFARAAAGCTFHEPTAPVVSNVTGDLAGRELLSQADYWRRHLREPVRFQAGVERLATLGIDGLVEVGPHPTLIGMAQACGTETALEGFPSLRRNRPDWGTLQESIGALWVRGVGVDDARYDEEFRPATRVAFPGHPLERLRCWVEPGASGERPSRNDHPLLGSRRRSPGREAVFEGRLAADRPAFVADHVVFGSPVFPATGYLEMARAAFETACGRAPRRLENVDLEAALVLDAPRVTHGRVDRSGTRTTFELHSAAADAPAGGESWCRHAEVHAGFDADEASPEPQGDPMQWIAETTLEPIDGEEFYAEAAALGLCYGPCFRGVEKVWRRTGDAVGRIRRPAALTEVLPGGDHPALLDAGLQVMIAALPRDAEGRTETYLPVHLGAVELWAPLPETFWARVSLEEARAGAPTLTGRLELVDGYGRPLLRIERLQLRRTAAGAFERRESLDEALVRLTWDVQPLTAMPAGGEAADWLPPLPELADRTAAGFDALAAETGLEVYARVEPELDALCADYFGNGLLELGWSRSPGERLTLDEVAESLGVVSEHRRLLDYALGVLADEGVLERTGDGFEVRRELAPVATDVRADRLAAAAPAIAAELRVTRRCGEHLAAVLRGDQDPLQLLFPDGKLNDLEELYTRAPFTRVYNGLVRDAVRDALTHLPADRPVRLLEIGAGTGGTATWVLPELPADRAEYTYTDVSNLFTARARERFPDYPFVRYGLLDIDRDPFLQGYERQAHDIVLATNVLHATADLSVTLGRVRELLAPEGLLVVVEGLGPQRWVDLIFGMTEGWWRSKDRDHPLVGLGRWKQLLRELRFRDPRTIPGEDDADALFHQAVILARAPGAEEPAARATARSDVWLLLSDGRGVADGLAERLGARGERVILATAASTGVPRPIERGPDRFELDPAHDGAVADLLHTLTDRGTVVRGAVHLWSLDDPLGDDADLDRLEAAQRRGYGGLLQLARALAGREGAELAGGLWSVTRGAQALPGDGPGPGVEHAPVWGLGRVIALEHPELACRRVDLDPGRDADVADQLDDLARELLAGDDEDQLAWRAGERRVARLRPRPSAAELPAPPYRLEIGERGDLDRLEWRSTSEPVPGAGELAIDVDATGLNFKDVLNALGQYPGDPGPLGLECAGRVAAVGPGVTRFAPGDHVVAIAAGGFAPRIVRPEAFVSRRPAGLSAAQAATLPVAYLTAWDALVRHGGLQSGQSVLIHAAAGGVGMAAVQIARSRGAIVYATAGSPAKRERVRALGVRDVFSSRDLDFADEIRRRTEGRGVDVALNSLAGEFVDRTIGLVADGGAYLEIGKADTWSPERFERERPDARYHAIDMGAEIDADPGLCREMFDEVVSRVEAGDWRPLPAVRFAETEAPAAFRYMAAARHVGKIVVDALPDRRDVDLDAVIRPDGAYLITGGLGGLGLLFADWLADRGARRLVLTARRAPSADADGRLTALRARGVDVTVHAADVGDPGALSEVLESVRAAAPLRGILHAAGTLDDGALLQQTPERFATVARAKVRGAWLLHRLTASDPVELFVLFSTATAMLGTRGQANHAAANAFMDRLASWRRARGRHGLSIQWGAWSGIGRAAELHVLDRLAASGLGAIEPEVGVAAFERLLAASWVHDDPASATVAVAPMHWARYLAGLGPDVPPQLRALAVEHATGETTVATAEGSLVDRLAAADPLDREDLLQAALAERVATSLGLDPSRPIDPLQPLSELGLDSLMAVEMRGRLSQTLELSRPLPATLLFDYPTLTALTVHLLNDVLQLGDAGSPQEAPGTASTEVADDLADLSDEEAEALLLEELGRERDDR